MVTLAIDYRPNHFSRFDIFVITPEVVMQIQYYIIVQSLATGLMPYTMGGGDGPDGHGRMTSSLFTVTLLLLCEGPQGPQLSTCTPSLKSQFFLYIIIFFLAFAKFIWVALP
jgi:hypothetical protein